MPFPSSKKTYIHPLRENYNGNSDHHGVFVSPMQLLEVSENNNLTSLNGEIDLKNMDDIKTAYLENLNSIHSKLFAGVEEIQKWKTSVEMESKQKNKKVEQLLQTLEVQRKTILDLQLQNEHVSSQLSEEIQQRSFVLKNLHSTKELCSALKKHYNTLQGHFEYRNKIEEGFNLADAKRLSVIDSLQNKFERVCREHSKKIAYLNDSLASETNKALNLKENLEHQIAIFDNEKESLCKMIEDQQLEIRRISTELDEERNKCKFVMEEKNTAFKFKVQELQGLIEMHSSNLRESEEALHTTRNEKLDLEKKLLSEKKRIDNFEMEIRHCLEAAKLQEKESEEKITALNDTISSLENKIQNIETELNEGKHTNENLLSTVSLLQKEKDDLELMIAKAKDELASYQQLKNEYNTLEQQKSVFTEREKYFNITVEELNEKLLHYKSERERETELHDEKKNELKQLYEDSQNKLIASEEMLKHIEENNTELLLNIKILEDNLKMKTDEVIMQEKKLLEMENLKLSMQKTEEQLQVQKAENMDIMTMLNDVEASYNNDRIVKEKEIIKFQELVHRLEDELRMLNVKVEEIDALKSLNEKQRDEIEELKFSVAKQQEELNEAKSENEKLKENLKSFRNLTVENKSLNKNKKEDGDLIKLEEQNKSVEAKKSEKSKVSSERKRRKINETTPSHLEKNKWEVDSSGSEYFELAFDKESEKITGFTPQKSPSSIMKLNTPTPKNSSFNARLSIQEKRENQCVISDNRTKKFGLPLKKNKFEPGNSIWMQALKTPDRNVDFQSVKENLDLGTDKKIVLGNTLTPAGQRKFFKTPLSDRENKFKKTTSDKGWSDFLKSEK